MSIKVAVTTSDRQNIDLHFGAADAFCIYELSDKGEAQLTEVRNIPAEWVTGVRTGMQSKGCCGKNQGNITSIAGLLGDCKYLLTVKIGPHPYKVMQSKGISCLEISCPIREAMEKLSAYRKRISGSRNMQNKIDT